ncbi:riboflavin-binding protein-like [Mixophyes fleayi]|uniref:riboflavin-binding protein-like n=1 Tax=Mixophyes fleayi TaxID=3061075 RepID=UPI003F4E2ECD
MRRLLIVLALAVLAAGSDQLSCLHGNHHKAAPSPEPEVEECLLYSASSCCYANFTEKLSRSPTIEVDNYYWNRCGNLSKTCEDYLKKIECFYQCSPIAAHWVHPNISAAIQNVPICQSFCDNWFEACRSDLLCVHNFLTDWIIDETGNHCKNECIPYHQMYRNGTDLCQSAWGSSFVVSPSPCRCLDMTQTDGNVVKYILESEHSEESGEEQACKPRLKGPEGKEEPGEDD